MDLEKRNIFKKLYENGGLKILLACSPIYVLLLNLGYYAYWRGYSSYFNIHISNIEWNNYSLFNMLFGIALLVIYGIFNFIAFSAVVNKDRWIFFGMIFIFFTFFLMVLLIDIKEITTDFKLSDLKTLLFWFIYLFCLVHFIGIYAGLCVLLDRRNKTKNGTKENKTKENKTGESKKVEKEAGSVFAIKVDQISAKYNWGLRVLVGVIICLAGFFYFGILNARNITNFKVIDKDYAVIYENSNDFIVAKIENGKINTLIQKKMKKAELEVELVAFEGNFLKRYIE